MSETPKDCAGEITEQIMVIFWPFQDYEIKEMGQVRLKEGEYNKVFSHVYEVLKRNKI